MKHVTRVSADCEGSIRRLAIAAPTPDSADAKSDFLNAIYRAWSDFVFQKKNEAGL